MIPYPPDPPKPKGRTPPPEPADPARPDPPPIVVGPHIYIPAVVPPIPPAPVADPPPAPVADPLPGPVAPVADPIMGDDLKLSLRDFPHFSGDEKDSFAFHCHF